MSTKQITTEDLTLGERLIVARHRAQKTQAQWSKKHGITVMAYRAWESDVIPRDRKGRDLAIPTVTIGRISPLEVCRVLRARDGRPRAVIAADIGVSVHWLSRMESGHENPAKLYTYWKIRPTSATANQEAA